MHVTNVAGKGSLRSTGGLVSPVLSPLREDALQGRGVLRVRADVKRLRGLPLPRVRHLLAYSHAVACSTLARPRRANETYWEKLVFYFVLCRLFSGNETAIASIVRNKGALFFGQPGAIWNSPLAALVSIHVPRV